MFKNSFLLILLVVDSRYPSTNLSGYEKSSTIRTKRSPAVGTRERISHGGETLFQDEVLGPAPESGGTVRRESWREDRNGTAHREQMAQAVRERGNQGSGDASWTWTQAYHGLLRRGSRPSCDRAGSAERGQGAGGMATGQREGGQRVHIQAFFISIGARYKRIRKRPRGKPSPQLYEYKAEKLQELERKADDGRIDLYYADESHVCTEGYVPYGWQFQGEDVHIPSQKIARLNIFGMTTRDNRYEGFTSRSGITAEKLADFLDRLSLKPREWNTVIVLDNASIHRSKLIKELRPVWENRGLFLFYLPPYSPHLNIAETLWRILKGKWIRPQDYESTDSLFYAADRPLAAIGSSLFVNHSHYAA